jgi:hypothetical protein
MYDIVCERFPFEIKEQYLRGRKLIYFLQQSQYIRYITIICGVLAYAFELFTIIVSIHANLSVRTHVRVDASWWWFIGARVSRR